MNDSSYNELSTDYYQRMQAAYNYSNAQQKATKLKTENTNMRYLIICAFALLLISSLILYIVTLSSKKKQETSKRNIQEWREKYKDLQQSKAEITTLKAMNDKLFINNIAEKEEQIVYLEQRLSKLQEEKIIRCISDTEEQLINAPIVQLFKESVYNTNQQLTLEDWKKLRTHVNSIMPSFLSTLMEKCPQIRDEELYISMLIRLHFTLKEITYLKSISHQNLYSLRKRLLNKVFRKEGTAKE